MIFENAKKRGISEHMGIKHSVLVSVFKKVETGSDSFFGPRMSQTLLSAEKKIDGKKYFEKSPSTADNSDTGRVLAVGLKPTIEIKKAF